MSFVILNTAAERLRFTLKASTERDLIAKVSLETPSEEATELNFLKSIMWGYSFWIEACQPAGRFLLNIVRNTSPTDHKLASRAFTDVQNLRVTKAHNLNPSTADDQYKLNQAKIWLVQNGGEPPNWGACTTCLCNSLATAVNILTNKWELILSNAEDARIGIEQLLHAIDQDWPAHLFDRIVEEAAAHLQLKDLDPVAYRKSRIQDWRLLTEMFSERSSAEAAVKRAIAQELTFKFGDGLSRPTLRYGDA